MIVTKENNTIGKTVFLKPRNPVADPIGVLEAAVKKAAPGTNIVYAYKVRNLAKSKLISHGARGLEARGMVTLTMRRCPLSSDGGKGYFHYICQRTKRTYKGPYDAH